MKPYKILERGIALCKVSRYEEILKGKKYPYDKRQKGSNIFIRLYYNNDWGKEEYYNYPISDFKKHFEAIKE